MEEGEVATFRHFLLFCTDFERLRWKYLGSHTFGKPGDIVETDISRLSKFVIGSKRFVSIQVKLYKSFMCQNGPHS